MKVGIKDISERTGYSIATVSNALNNKPGVNSQTSSRIFQAAQELGYINHSKITRVRFVTYRRNGLILDSSPFFQSLIESVEKETCLCGYEIVFSTLDRTSDDYEDRLSVILGDISAALILLGTEMMEDDYIPFERYANPIIILDGWCSNTTFDCVLINNIDAVTQAVRHLIAKGHSNIGHLKSSAQIYNFTQRSAGLQSALQASGLSLQQDFIVPLTPTLEGAYQDMSQWPGGAASLPTAFFADNDVIALGALRALREAGYRVPEDISVIGFDNLLLCEASVPRLTTVHVFTQDMGRVAVRRLMYTVKCISELTAKTKTYVCTQLVERDSVSDLQISDE